MAICDAHYRFTYIEAGAFGSEGDMKMHLGFLMHGGWLCNVL